MKSLLFSTKTLYPSDDSLYTPSIPFQKPLKTSFKPRSNSLELIPTQEIQDFPMFFSHFKRIFSLSKVNLLEIKHRIPQFFDTNPPETVEILKELSILISDFLENPPLKILKEECRRFVEKVKSIQSKLFFTQDLLKISLKTTISPRLPPSAVIRKGNTRISSKKSQEKLAKTFVFLRFSLAEILNFSLIFSIFYMNIEKNFASEEKNLRKTLKNLNKEEFFIEFLAKINKKDLFSQILSRNLDDLKAFQRLKLRKWLNSSRISLQKTIETLDSSHKLICRLCENYIKAEYMKIHSEICHKLIENKRNITGIEAFLKDFGNTAFRLQQRLSLELEMAKKKVFLRKTQNSLRGSPLNLEKTIKRSTKSFEMEDFERKIREIEEKSVKKSFFLNSLDVQQKKIDIINEKTKDSFEIPPKKSIVITKNTIFQKKNSLEISSKNKHFHKRKSSFDSFSHISSQIPQKPLQKPSNFVLNLIIPESVSSRPKAYTLNSKTFRNYPISFSNSPKKRRPDSILLYLEEENKEKTAFEIKSFQIPCIANALNSVIKYRGFLEKDLKIGDLTNELRLKKEVEISLKEIREKNIEVFLKKILDKIEEKLEIQWKIDALEAYERRKIRLFTRNNGEKSQNSPIFKKAKTNRRFSNAAAMFQSNKIERNSRRNSNNNLETVDEISSSLLLQKIKDNLSQSNLPSD